MSTSYTPERGGQDYTIPAMEDPADAPLAFREFADSMPPQLVPVKEISSPYEVVTGDNGNFLVSDGNCLVTFASDLPEGFNVALTLSSAGTIGMEGVVGEENIPFEKVGSVVKAGGILYSSVSIGEVIEVEGSVGGPTAPTSISVVGNMVTSGPAGPGEAGPVLAYGAKVTSEKEDDNFTWDLTQPADPRTEGPVVFLTGTTPFTNYQVEIFGLNIAGRGEGIWSNKFEINYNKATGGTETIVENYNGTGETWRVHTFTSNDNFDASVSVNPYRILVVNSGSKGSNGPGTGEVGNGDGGGAGGAGGLVKTHEDATLPQGVSEVKASTSIGAYTAAGGGRGGGGHGAPHYGQSGRGGDGPKSDVSGANKHYGGGGGGGSTDGCNGNGAGGGGAGGGGAGGGGNGNPGAAHSGGGGGGGGDGANPCQGRGLGGNGGSGVVVVAYQIGITPARRIKQLEAEEAARQAGVEEGLEQGIQQGYAQAQQDLQEELTSLRTQIAEAAGTIVEARREIEG